MSEYLIPISIECLEKGGHLATSDTIQGLIARNKAGLTVEDFSRL